MVNFQGGFSGGQPLVNPNYREPYRPSPYPERQPGVLEQILTSFGSGAGTGVGNAFEKGVQSNLQRQSIAKLKEMHESNPHMGVYDQLDAISQLPEGLQKYANEAFERNAKYGPPTAQQLAADQALQQGVMGTQGQPQPQQPQLQGGINTPLQSQVQDQPQEPQEAAIQPAVSPEIAQIDQRVAQLRQAYPTLSRDGKVEAAKQLKDLQDQRRKATASDYELGVKANEGFREELNKDFENYNFKRRVLNQMENLNENEDLSTPAMQTLLEKLNLPTGFLNNPSAEEFEKLSQQLMNDIQSTYGSRLNIIEVQNYAKQIPTLMNTKEGRKRVIRDLKNLNEARKVKYQTYQDISKGGRNLPLNLREMVTAESQNRLQKMEDQLLDSIQYFKPITMYKDGQEYPIPATYAHQALLKGYTLQKQGAGEAQAGAPANKPEWFGRKQGKK